MDLTSILPQLQKLPEVLGRATPAQKAELLEHMERRNNVSHWFTANVIELDGHWTSHSYTNSWVNGEKRRVPIYYWDVTLWQPLTEYWNIAIPQDALNLLPLVKMNPEFEQKALVSD